MVDILVKDMAENMQTKYPNKLTTPHWDYVNVEYPTKKFPSTGQSSKTLGHDWKGLHEIILSSKTPYDEIKVFSRDYNLTKDVMRSKYAVDFDFKHPETDRFNKHTPCTENHYIYPPSRRLTDQPPLCGVHGTTEMRSAYKRPIVPVQLVTGKDQFKYPFCMPMDPPEVEPSWHKELEPLDTTHEGFEKYLDPYLTTSRLHHRPYTADQLNKPSNAKNIVTYYTFSDTPMVRTPKIKPDDWRLPMSRPKSMYDREKFKQDTREIRTHNKPNWVPGAFRTEVRDNFTAITSKPESKIHNLEEAVTSAYHQAAAHLPVNKEAEHSAILQGYKTENAIPGSGKRLCSVIDQYPEKNKRLELKEMGFKNNTRNVMRSRRYN